jgi:hypothetical protein
MEIQETVAQETLRLIEPIPEGDFISSDYTDYESKCCLAGHLTRLKSENPLDFSFDNCSDMVDKYMVDKQNPIRKISEKFIQEKFGIKNIDIIDVNNGTIALQIYNFPSQKQRVVACLKDMIKAGL